MKNTGDGRRVQRVERELQEVISRFLMGTFKGDLPGIVTVTRIKMPADLRSAKVGVSVLNGEIKDHNEAAHLLQERAVEIQRYLAKEFPMRYTPKLTFVGDSSIEKVLQVDRILHELSKDKKNDEGETT